MTDSPICLTDSPEIVLLKCEFGALDARDQELKAVAAKSRLEQNEHENIRCRKREIATRIFLSA